MESKAHLVVQSMEAMFRIVSYLTFNLQLFTKDFFTRNVCQIEDRNGIS